MDVQPKIKRHQLGRIVSAEVCIRVMAKQQASAKSHTEGLTGAGGAAADGFVAPLVIPSTAPACSSHNLVEEEFAMRPCRSPQEAAPRQTSAPQRHSAKQN